MEAVIYNATAYVDIMVSYGANLDLRSPRGLTMVELAESKKLLQMQETLSKHLYDKVSSKFQLDKG